MEPKGPARVESRLAAILAADVAGHSRLIGADEEGSLSRLKTLRAEVIAPQIAEHHGRIVKTTRDSLLCDPASAINAMGIFRRRHGREESVIKLTLVARRSPYDAYG